MQVCVPYPICSINGIRITKMQIFWRFQAKSFPSPSTSSRRPDARGDDAPEADPRTKGEPSAILSTFLL
jgi:hypothetical protein